MVAAAIGLDPPTGCVRAAPSKARRRAFDCGQESLNRWLAVQARQSMATRDAVTYLLIDDDPAADPENATSGPIAGYYCLSAGQVAKAAMPGDLSRAAPDPIPVVRMDRLAVGRAYQGSGWGAELLREALLSAAAAVRLIGGRALLVDAIDERAEAFYRRFGFRPSPVHPLQLLYRLDIVTASAGLDGTKQP